MNSCLIFGKVLSLLTFSILGSSQLQTIPFKFALDHLKQKSGNVILQILGRKTWTVGYKIYNEYALARFSSGWPAFAGDNNLKTGTECVFELINPAELVLNVVSVRAGKEKITQLPGPREKYPCAKTNTK